MQYGQPVIQSCETTLVCARKAGQISICDLAVAEDAAPVNCFVGKVIRPEMVAGMFQKATQNCHGFLDILNDFFAHQVAQQCALGDWAGGEVAGVALCKPLYGSIMMHMVAVTQGDQNIPVKQRDHKSSSSERTSSEVIGRLERKVGKPVMGLTV